MFFESLRFTVYGLRFTVYGLQFSVGGGSEDLKLIRVTSNQ